MRSLQATGGRWRTWAAVAGIAALTGIAFEGTRTLRINFTSSLPRGLYRNVKGPASRGAMVLACLPPAVARFAHARGYVWRGNCPGGAAPVGKVVSAIAGDSVVVAAAGLSINGHQLPNTVAMAHDSKGRPLGRIPYATYVVPPGELWLTSTYNPASFDSRYFGPVVVTSVLSRIEPLWTLRTGTADRPKEHLLDRP